MANIVTADQIETFRSKLQSKLAADWAAQGNTGTPPTIDVMPGQKYVRLVYVQGPGNRSCYGFIDASNGALLKSDGWKKPAKGVRGNIFGPDPLAGCDRYGMAYMR